MGQNSLGQKEFGPTVPVSQCTCVPASMYSSVPVSKCSGVFVSQCPSHPEKLTRGEWGGTHTVVAKQSTVTTGKMAQNTSPPPLEDRNEEITTSGDRGSIGIYWREISRNLFLLVGFSKLSNPRRISLHFSSSRGIH